MPFGTRIPIWIAFFLLSLPHSNQQEQDHFQLIPSRYPSTLHFSDIQVNTYTPGDQDKHAIAALGEDRFILVWETDGVDGSEDAVVGQILDASGAKIGVEFQLNTYTLKEQEDPFVASLAAGGFVTVWESDEQDGDDDGVFGQLFNSSGHRFGPELQVHTDIADKQGDPNVAALGTGFVVVWRTSNQDRDESSHGIKGQLFDSNGSRVGSDFWVNTFVADDQEDPEVTALGDQRFVVTWQSESQDGDNLGIYAQIFDAAANKIGPEIHVNDVVAGKQEKPRIAAVGEDRFFIVWSSGPEHDSEVWFQGFSSTGERFGPQVRVGAHAKCVHANASKTHPAVSALGDSSLVLTWTQTDGNESGVFGQVFDVTGAEMGHFFRVNAVAAHEQSRSRVVALSDERFVVSWRSTRQDGDGRGVFCRIFIIPPPLRPGAASAVTVLETLLPGSVVGMFVSSVNGLVVFELAEGEGADDNHKFELVDGELLSRSELDCEEKSMLSIRVRETAAGSGVQTEQVLSVIVGNVNEPPVALNLSSPGILELQPAQVVGLLTVTDPDLADTVQFTLVDGDGDGGNAQFSIVGSELRSVGEIFRNESGEVSVRVRATDGGGLYVERRLSIRVLRFDVAAEASFSATLHMSAADFDSSAREAYKAAIRAVLPGVRAIVEIDDAATVERQGRRLLATTLELPTRVKVAAEGAQLDLAAALHQGLAAQLAARDLILQGHVRFGNQEEEPASQPAPAGEAAAEAQRVDAALVGGVVGGVLAGSVVLAGVLMCVGRRGERGEEASESDAVKGMVEASFAYGDATKFGGREDGDGRVTATFIDIISTESANGSSKPREGSLTTSISADDRPISGAASDNGESNRIRRSPGTSSSSIKIQVLPIIEIVKQAASNAGVDIEQGDSPGKFSTSMLMLGGPSESACGLKKALGLDDNREFAKKLKRGCAAIEEEWTANGDEEDRANFEYVYRGEAQAPGSMPAHIKACIANGVYHGGALGEGDFDSEHGGMRLADFVDHEHSRLAELSTAEVLSLRLYTSSSFPKYNTPLRDRTKHQFPMTVYHLGEGLKKLRAVQAKLNPADFNKERLLWRGMKNITLDLAKFEELGGTELAPMSTTMCPEVALKYADSDHPMVFMYRTRGLGRGCSIRFLSMFPREREFLYPPLTYLQPDGEPMMAGKVTIIPVAPQMS